MTLGKLPILILIVLVFLVSFNLLFWDKASAAVNLQILDYPHKVKIEVPFTVTASVSGLPADQSFKYKVGLANADSSWYGYGEIKNGDNWIGYNDADSCNLAPEVKTNAQGHWEGEAEAKVRLGAKTGTAQLRFRVCDPSKSSDSYEINLLEADKPLDPESETTSEQSEETEKPADAASEETAETAVEIKSNSIVEEETVTNQPAAPLVLPSKTVKEPDYKLPATLSAIEANLHKEAATESSQASMANSTNNNNSNHQAVTKYVIISGIVTLLVIAIIIFLVKKRL